MIDIKNGRFRWANKLAFYSLNNYTIGMLFYNGLKVSLELIKLSGWDKQDFLTAIKYKEDHSSLAKIELCTQDLKKNIDKYLNEIIIKDIIE